MKTITNRDDMKPDTTPGACTHRAMGRHLGGDASRWSCFGCGLEVGTDDHGRPLRPLHPLWPLEVVPRTADDEAVQILSTEGAQCGACGDEPGDRKCPDCEEARQRYIAALRTAGWAPRSEIQQHLDAARAELAAIKKDLAALTAATQNGASA